ncbi:hypothetical protein UFOVP276_86 [uncultured Caudovirales phage]|uniref:Uncharacterized protein n=1 Tax=uncultured Caudovirales phage TaxID=2100421 RepID=A0A6J5LQ43_9CAUD|nr:hypothetical protein UFOVP127_223 [uncultured Caudovirales phage]CAB4135130.1 hypothetical protein UFOVP276_86 [uncultured Caudovirales phage]
MTTKPNEVQPETTAKRNARKYKEIEEELKAFLKDPDIRPILEELYDLVKRRNELLDVAIRDVKSELQRSDHRQLVYDGIGAQKKTERYYDTDFLAEHLPVGQADLVLSRKITYELNQPMLEQMVRQGEVDNDIVRQAYHEKAQTPSAMPGTPKPFALPALPME